MKKISIIGSGSWALALTKVIVEKKIKIKFRNTFDKKKFSNKKIQLTNKFEKLNDSEYIFLAIPSQSIRENLIELRAKTTNKNFVFIVCSKGVEKKTCKLMNEVLLDIYPKNRIVILSGPNFSSELIAKKPSACVLSSSNEKTLLNAATILSQKRFRIYFNNDIIGTQLGGAMKNVIAIACGFVKGSKLGENARAAIITRGLSEIVKLGLNMGAKRKTFYGLSGIGDLILTCSSLKSRNTKFGFDLATGKRNFHLQKNTLLEGVESCESICNLGIKYKVELPLCNSVQKIIKGVDSNKIISKLLSRPLQFEN